MGLISAFRTLTLAAAAAFVCVPVSAVSSPAELAVSHIDGAFDIALRFDGRQLDLTLERSASVADVAASGTEHLVGSVVDAPDSWARLSLDQTGGWAFGLVRHGDTLFAIDRRPSGLLWVESLQTIPPDLEAVTRVLPLAVVVDTAYDEAFDGFGRRRAVALVNQLDGLYREQLGLGVELVAARVLADPERDPMRHTEGSLAELLLAFRRYRQSDKTLPEGVGAVHLFSGAQLSDRRMGLAYTGGVCDPSGHDVSVSRTRLELVTLAHELAHSLGASHDQQSACAAQGLLMDATVRRGASLQMSDCTVRTIQAGFTRGCFKAAPSGRQLAFSTAGLLPRDGLRFPEVQGSVPPTEPVSPFALLVIAVAAVGLVRRRN